MRRVLIDINVELEVKAEVENRQCTTVHTICSTVLQCVYYVCAEHKLSILCEDLLGVHEEHNYTSEVSCQKTFFHRSHCVFVRSLTRPTSEVEVLHF